MYQLFPNRQTSLLTVESHVGRLTPPIVAGGVGGSGTRLIAQWLRVLGVDMGRELNESEDALAFLPLYAHINDYLAGTADPEHLAEDLRTAIRRHRVGATDGGVWGWKNPRSIYLLPVLDALLPGCRYVHVIRDGLAMATSDNQNQLRLHGEAVLGAAAGALTPAARALRLWARVNQAAADYGEQRMDGRYLRLRYEEAVTAPEATLARLADFAGLTLPAGVELRIRPARMRTAGFEAGLDPLARDEVRAALARFGYPSC